MHLDRLFSLLFIILVSSSINAQTTVQPASTDRIEQLDIVQSVLDGKIQERINLREKISSASPDDLSDLEARLVELNNEIKEIRVSFEQIAIGSVDLTIFDAENTEFDWRTEMTQVLMPVIRNLQSLTEKPRRIEDLRSQISANNEKLMASNIALAAIEENLLQADNEETKQSLINLRSTWQDQVQEIGRSTEIANVKLNNLLSNNDNFFQSAKSAIVNFLTGRGLTLLIALIVAFLVWLVLKFVKRILTARTTGSQAKSYRTRQRLVRYAFNIFTALLITISVIIVFYVRGDVLLLGLSLLVAGALVLGLRHTVPKFISEARLLLNMGSIREDERVVYNGLPYQVTALNMYSVLRNPELTGVIRLPLESMMSMISRPAGKEVWFPASKGDYIMLPEGKLLEVVELTTELIQLQSLVGTRTSVPSSEFYNMTFDNLSRGENFSITSTFGVGYLHQSISNNSIPTKLKEAISEALSKTDYAEHVVSVSVELKEAGASSLDYWVCVTCSTAAVRSYYKISRLVQQSCVDTCTRENWDIPFPQLTIHNQ